MPAVVSPRFGWLGEQNAERVWPRMAHLFIPFEIKGSVGSSEGKRVALWDAARAANGGKDIEHPPQLIGDCVGMSTVYAVNYLALWEIHRLGQSEAFRPAFCPYVYGASRCMPDTGRKQLGNQDGSLGSWMAVAVQKYGILPADTPGCPDYTAQVAKQWGAQGPPKEFLTHGAKHLIKSAARIRSYVELRDGLTNGYPAIYASNLGHAMDLQYDRGKGWHKGRDVWPHQRPILAVDDDPARPGIFMGNQWGNAHGQQPDGPPIGGWIDADVIDTDLKKSGTECFMLSAFQGFPSNETKPNFLLI